MVVEDYKLAADKLNKFVMDVRHRRVLEFGLKKRYVDWTGIGFSMKQAAEGMKRLGKIMGRLK